MPHADFVHLRLHSAYSLSEGAIRIKELAGLCRRNEMPAVAVTDSGNLFGALEFSEAMAAGGIQPIIGCVIALSTVTAGPDDGYRSQTAGMGANSLLLDHILLLAQNEAGYRNLLHLSSRAYLGSDDGEPPHVTMEDVAEHSAGLIALTGGLAGFHMGPVARLLHGGQKDAAVAMVQRLAAIFDGRLYMEIQRHGLADETAVESELIALADRFDIPIVATNDVFFATADMFQSHDALLCIAEGATVGQSDRRSLTPENWFKSADEMRALFTDLPEALDNSMVIARRCAFRVPKHAPILPKFGQSGDTDEAEMLRLQAFEGLQQRLNESVYQDDMDEAAREAAAQPYLERLEFELGVIIRMDYPGYFLIVADFIQWAKKQAIPVGPGRGSGAGSVVAWALTITDLDPLRFGLLFERFLNPERVSMPDFDIDFCQDKRDQVISYVQQKYGNDQVAQIITFGKLQARAALRDVGRVLQMPYGQVDRLCKMIPNNPANPVSLGEAIKTEPRLAAERDSDPTVANLLKTALQLEGLYRHASTHAAGVVIGDRPLEELVPLYRDPRSDMPVTQFSMKWAEEAGLVKFDFLGLKTLTVLDRARELLLRQGIEIDFLKLPLDDPATYKMLGRGESVGVFQLESSGMRDVLRKMRADKFEDIIALVALYRPGPMDNIPTYIKRKLGEEAPDFLDEKLEPVLKETHGIMIYQEQVMQIAQILAGYSLGEADLLRRAMGKKIQAEMDAQRERFVSGAVERGMAESKAHNIFDLVNKFAGYGFNKSHAAAYALIAYQTAWLKANHPVIFLAASMSLELNNTDKLALFRQEAQRSGITVLQPDINRSEVEFSVEKTVDHDTGEEIYAVRYALAAIKNVGRGAMEALVCERAKTGLFRDIADFADRLDNHQVNRRQLENLARAGAFDNLNEARSSVLASVGRILAHAGAKADDRESGQGGLFDESGGVRLTLERGEHWSPFEQLNHEFDALGLYLSAHPLDDYRRMMERERIISFAELEARMEQETVVKATLAGTVQGIQNRRSARGSAFAFVQLSDLSGVYEVSVFSELLDSARDILEIGNLVVVTVESKRDSDSARLSAQAVRSLETMAAASGDGLKIYIADSGPLDEIQNRLSGVAQGKGRISFVLNIEDKTEDNNQIDAGEVGDLSAHKSSTCEVEVDLAQHYQISPALAGALRTLPGVLDIREV